MVEIKYYFFFYKIENQQKLIYLQNFVKVYGKDDAFETEMKEYEGGTVIRKVAVSGKPNEYKVSEFLATGAGTAVYKSLLILFYFMYTDFEIYHSKIKS